MQNVVKQMDSSELAVLLRQVSGRIATLAREEAECRADERGELLAQIESMSVEEIDEVVGTCVKRLECLTLERHARLVSSRRAVQSDRLRLA